MTITFEIALIVVMLACVLFLFSDNRHQRRIEYALIFGVAAAAMTVMLLLPVLL